MSIDGVRILRVSGVNLVFGMDWLPLLSGNLRRQAVVKARSHGASHVVVASEHTAAMGLVSLSEASAPKGDVHYSAAQTMAMLHPVGTVIILVALDPETWWLVGVHEGAVIARTDLLFSVPQEAAAIMAELRSAFARAQVMDGSTLETPDRIDGPLDLARAVDKRAMLWRVRHRGRVLRYGGYVVLSCALAGMVGLALDLPDVFGVAPPGPELMSAASRWQAWESSRNSWARGIHVHGVGGMQRLLESLYQMPVSLAGWRLGQVDCRPQSADWRCVALYRRLSRDADNQGFMGQASAHWQLRFSDVNTIQAEWVVTGSATPLLESPLDDARQADRVWLSSLQQISTAFVMLKATPATEVTVSAPVDPQGIAIARPETFRLYQRRQLQVEGPLRSYSVLLANLAGVRWQTLTLTVRELDQPALLSSRLHLSGQGERYEWQR